MLAARSSSARQASGVAARSRQPSKHALCKRWAAGDASSNSTAASAPAAGCTPCKIACHLSRPAGNALASSRPGSSSTPARTSLSVASKNASPESPFALAAQSTEMASAAPRALTKSCAATTASAAASPPSPARCTACSGGASPKPSAGAGASGRPTQRGARGPRIDVSRSRSARSASPASLSSARSAGTASSSVSAADTAADRIAGPAAPARARAASSRLARSNRPPTRWTSASASVARFSLSRARASAARWAFNAASRSLASSSTSFLKPAKCFSACDASGKSLSTSRAALSLRLAISAGSPFSVDSVARIFASRSFSFSMVRESSRASALRNACRSRDALARV